MKMLMIVYNEALDNEVMEALEQSIIKNYTKVTKTFGRGYSSGTHLGTDIWPGLNNIIYAACDSPQLKEAFLKIKELRKKVGYEGVKAFAVSYTHLTLPTNREV